VFAHYRSMTTLHVVLGGTGSAGNAIARALADEGLPVRAVSRGGGADLPASVEQRRADVTTAAGAAGAVAGAGVVYLAAQPAYHRWPQEFPAMLETVLAATAAEHAKLVMVDNLYAYGPGTGPIQESTPHRARDAKGTVRAAMAERLLQAHAEGFVRVAIGQASDYFGPRGDNSGITALAIEPVATGGTLRWMGSLDTPHSAAYLPDIARAYAVLGTRDEADGRAWILPHARAVTGAQFLALVNDALPQPLRTARVSTTMLRLAAPFHRISRESLSIAYQWTAPFVADDSEFQRVLGPLEVTPLDEAVATTVQWYRGGSR
jgi:nucleoside-diphosphate-sugar epimerase